jgi:hypothetical protein
MRRQATVGKAGLRSAESELARLAQGPRRPHSQDPGQLIQLEPGSLQVLDHRLRQLTLCVVTRMLQRDPAEQITAARQCTASPPAFDEPNSRSQIAHERELPGR